MILIANNNDCLNDITKDNLIKDDNGNTYLRYYDSEFKFWINIRCNDGNGTDALKGALKTLFLNKYNL